MRLSILAVTKKMHGTPPHLHLGPAICFLNQHAPRAADIGISTAILEVVKRSRGCVENPYNQSCATTNLDSEKEISNDRPWE